jgi:ornithine--oxo-acid transaminase
MLSDSEVMDMFAPGDHGSTFGGNPLGAAIARAALKVIVEENLPERARELGDWFMQELRQIESPHVSEVRGRGLMIGVVVKDESGPARPFCEALQQRKILAKETHEQVIRFAPPLVVERDTLKWALGEVAEVLAGAAVPG